MTPIEIALASVSLLSLVLGAFGALRRRNHVEADLRAQLDQALAENTRLAADLAKSNDELHAATVKLSPEVLASYARQAVAYSEQLGGSGGEKLRRAVEAAQKLDAGDNGKRDWSDAQIRIAIEAEVKKA